MTIKHKIAAARGRVKKAEREGKRKAEARLALLLRERDEKLIELYGSDTYNDEGELIC